MVQIEHDLKSLEKAGVKPIFVFSGITPQERDRPFQADDPKIWRRAQAWEHYEQGRVPQAQADFELSSPLIPQDVMRIVHRLFKQRSVEFVVAPYLAWAQLVYLERHEKAYIHSIYGSSELFMFDGIDRIILAVDFTSSTISFASKNAILTDIGVTPDQFLDIAILAGFDGSNTFPGLDPRDSNFRNVIDLVKTRGGGVAAVMAYKEYPPVFGSNYADQFARARCLIKFSLVLVAHEGRVLPLPLVLPPPPSSTAPITASDVPLDLSEVFSAPLPDEVYYQLFRGLVGPQIINTLTSGRWVEPMPLCGSTPEYERYVKLLTEAPHSPRCVSTALLSSVLHPSWSKKQVVRRLVSLPGPQNIDFSAVASQTAVYYFDPRVDFIIPHSSHPTNVFIESVSQWNVDFRLVENELRRQLVRFFLGPCLTVFVY